MAIIQRRHFILQPTAAIPLVGLLLLIAEGMGVTAAWLAGLWVIVLVGAIPAAVHHAEAVAQKVGEPYGTLVLALAITVIEVALIVSLMVTGGPTTAELARDTVFATLMLILNGMIGICLLVGASRHHEQRFRLHGVNAALTTLAAIAVLTLVLPNYTTSVPGPAYSKSQLLFVALVTLSLYGAFIVIQTVRHRDYFLPANDESGPEIRTGPPTWLQTGASTAWLVLCLAVVVLLAKLLAPQVEILMAKSGAPKALVGIIIAAVVLLPEGWAAFRAARANRLQTSLNLALGSALASIGLTIPVVSAISVLFAWPLTLGIDTKSTVLLTLTLFVTSLSLGTGRTTVLHGAIHVVLLATYVFTTIVP